MKDNNKCNEEKDEMFLERTSKCPIGEFEEKIPENNLVKKTLPLRDTVKKSSFCGLPGLPEEKYLLNANENPYDVFMFSEVRADFMRRLENMPANRYPDPAANELRQKMAEYVGVEKKNIIAGNGGDEVISMLINTFLNPGDKMLIHDPTFEVYGLDAGILGVEIIRVPDLADLIFDRQGFKKALIDYHPQMTVICNPNNPTGAILPITYIEEVLRNTDGIVVVDEAYMEFAEYEGGESALPLLEKYPNLVVVRTLSKAFGLAAYRIGYAVSDADLINSMMKVKAVFNLNSVSQNMGITALEHSDLILRHHVPAVLQAKKELLENLRKIDYIRVYPSMTNFVLIEICGEHTAAAINAELKEAGVKVSSYPQGSRLENCLRISVGEKEALDALLAVLRKSVSEL